MSTVVWYYIDGSGRTHGPESIRTMRRLSNDGIIKPNTLIRSDEREEWVRSIDCARFQRTLASKTDSNSSSQDQDVVDESNALTPAIPDWLIPKSASTARPQKKRTKGNKEKGQIQARIDRWLERHSLKSSRSKSPEKNSTENPSTANDSQELSQAGKKSTSFERSPLKAVAKKSASQNERGPAAVNDSASAASSNAERRTCPNCHRLNFSNARLCWSCANPKDDEPAMPHVSIRVMEAAARRLTTRPVAIVVAAFVLGLILLRISPDQVEEQQSSGDVQLTLEVEKLLGNRVALSGMTSLPAGTKLMLSVQDRKEGGFRGQSSCFVNFDGSFSSEAFGPQEGLPDGDYIADVLMPIAEVQPEVIQQQIGAHGELLKGPLVKRGAFGIVVSRNKEFEILTRSSGSSDSTTMTSASASRGSLESTGFSGEYEDTYNRDVETIKRLVLADTVFPSTAEFSDHFRSEINGRGNILYMGWYSSESLNGERGVDTIFAEFDHRGNLLLLKIGEN